MCDVCILKESDEGGEKSDLDCRLKKGRKRKGAGFIYIPLAPIQVISFVFFFWQLLPQIAILLESW